MEDGHVSRSKCAGASLCAIHRDVSTVDPAGAVRKEEHRHVGDLLRRTQAFRRKLPLLKGGKSVWIPLAEAIPAALRNHNGARTESVHPDLIRRQFHGQWAGQINLRGL